MTFGSGFNNPPVGNQGIIARALFRSIDFITGVSGWAIWRNGNAEFNDVVVRGLFALTDGNYAPRSQDIASEPAYNVTSTWVQFNDGPEWGSCIFKTFSNRGLVTVQFDGYNNNTAVSTLRIAHRIYSGPSISGPWTMEWDFNQLDDAVVTNSGVGVASTHQGFGQTVIDGFTADLANRPWIKVNPGWRISSGGPTTCKIFNGRLCVIPTQ